MFTIIISVVNCDSLGIPYMFLWVVSVPNCRSSMAFTCAYVCVRDVGCWDNRHEHDDQIFVFICHCPLSKVCC
jgi:hypothetical protein